MNGSEHRLLRVASELMFCVRLCQKSHRIYCRKSEKQYNVFDIFALPLSHVVLTSFFCILLTPIDLLRLPLPLPYFLPFCLSASQSRGLWRKPRNSLYSDVFTARCYASAVLAMRLCLCLSDTSRCSTKTAKRRITQTTPHDSPGTRVF